MSTVKRVLITNLFTGCIVYHWNEYLDCFQYYPSDTIPCFLTGIGIIFTIGNRDGNSFGIFCEDLWGGSDILAHVDVCSPN